MPLRTSKEAEGAEEAKLITLSAPRGLLPLHLDVRIYSWTGLYMYVSASGIISMACSTLCRSQALTTNKYEQRTLTSVLGPERIPDPVLQEQRKLSHQ